MTTPEKCDEHSGVCEAVKTLKENQAALFKKLDRIYFALVALLAGVVVDIATRIATHVK